MLSNEQHSDIVSDNLFPVVGVGASAGGLESFKKLVQAIPENSGMAYILIQHLSPDHESHLADFLQKLSKVPVVEITNNIKVEPNHIYVIPSNKLLIANAGTLTLEQRIKGETQNTIDVFFTSLAEVHQEHAIGVILSGTGHDGTVGLKTIKDQGGITIAEDSNSAKHDGMPRSAIDAHVVDLIIYPEDIPSRLDELVKTSAIIPSDFKTSNEINDEQVFNQIISHLRSIKGVDFSYYKQTTIRRRILRRKALNRIASLKEYQHFLLENKAEQTALFENILIPVTAFFRDAGIFNFLYDKVFPLAFKDKTPTDTIRVWVAGCSTGEEAYSIAIRLYEFFGERTMAQKIQVFASDLSASAIAKARRGIYLKKDMAGVSEERKNRFFTKVDGSYQVSKAIRDLCVFANQNFLKDPPFAKIDILSCRNVLIYMEPYLQKKAFSIFHYALNPTGFLWLGKSESIGISSEYFQPFSLHDKIFTKKLVPSKFLHAASENSEAAFRKNSSVDSAKSNKQDDFQKAADSSLLSKYASIGVIINEQLEIVQFRGSTGAYLESPSGKATHNILRMAREGLPMELKKAIDQARSGNKSVRREGIPLEKGKRKVSIEIIPLRNTIEPYLLVLFEDLPVISKPKRKNPDAINETRTAESNYESRVQYLENELSVLRDDMKTVIEDNEASNEELQSANEELLSSSEELQSLNEELETSKEEIESTNEELTTLNQELIERNEQLQNLQKYTQAIITTIHEPVVVLTKDFRLKSANEAFYEMFGITENEAEGKLFFHMNEGIWDVPGLKNKMQKILPEHSAFDNFELTISSTSGHEQVLLLNGRQIINETANEQLILMAIQDITTQKVFQKALEAEVSSRTQELRETNISLIQSNDNLRQFASIASHDLQEPLRKIKTFTTILDKKISAHVPATDKELISKIHLAADRMSQLIRELLQYSKVAQSKKEFTSTDMDRIVSNVLIDLDLLISETGTTIQYDQKLPVIDAIPLQMHQLVYNLIINAIKFQKPGLPPVVSITYKVIPEAEVTLLPHLRKELPYIEIIISDNGIGFAEQFSDQIFDLFERLHTAEEIPGSGLGLALCRKIIENHRGHIYAESKGENGSNFHIMIPTMQL